MPRIMDIVEIDDMEYHMDVPETELCVRVRQAFTKANPVNAKTQQKVAKAMRKKNLNSNDLIQMVLDDDTSFFDEIGVDPNEFNGGEDVDFNDQARLISVFFKISRSKVIDLSSTTFDALWNKIQEEYTVITIRQAEILKKNDAGSDSKVVGTENLD